MLLGRKKTADRLSPNPDTGAPKMLQAVISCAFPVIYVSYFVLSKDVDQRDSEHISRSVYAL
jgi:hypothetical protein